MQTVTRINRILENILLQINAIISDCGSLFKNDVFPFQKPVLEVQVEHSQLSRRRRRSTSMNCDPTSQDNTCCRHNLTVSFRNLGWDWVIGPSEFESYHCYGECMFLNLQGNYQRVHYLSHLSPSRSCCSPTKMAPIKLLYYDHDHNIIYSQVDDMVIQKCGCV